MKFLKSFLFLYGMVKSFTSSTGITIKIGERDVENDQLIKNAQQNYIWCHLDNMSSPHAIIECPDPDPATLNDALQLVKYYSKGKNAKNLNVIYTEIKNVAMDFHKAGLVHLRKEPCKKGIRTDYSCLRKYGLTF